MTWNVIQGDCLAEMRGLAPASVDACITDPPYGTTACSWDSVIPFGPMWAELKRIVKPKGAIVLFGSQPFTSALVMSNPAMFKYEWVWEKSKAAGYLDARRKPLKEHENLLVFCDGVPPYNAEMDDGEPFINQHRVGDSGACYGSDGHYCEVARARITRASGIACDIPKRVKEYAPTPLFEAVA